MYKRQGRSFAAFRDTITERDWPSDGKRVSYGIYTRDEELIGMVSCYNIDRRRRSGELGIYLGERELWGKGFGTDAMSTFLSHLFHDLDFDWLYLHTYESNTRAQRSYLHAGFQMEEKRRRYSPRAGYHQEVRMTITRDGFESMQYLPEVAAAN